MIFVQARGQTHQVFCGAASGIVLRDLTDRGNWRAAEQQDIVVNVGLSDRTGLGAPSWSADRLGLLSIF